MEEAAPSGQTTGVLDVKVFGYNEAQPISNAKVTVNEVVKDAAGNDVPGRILATVETTDTGNAPSIRLPAPPPGSDSPYTPYMLTVEAPGAQPKVIHGVQVFPEGPNRNRALQHVQLAPVPVPSPPGPVPISEEFMDESFEGYGLAPVGPTIEVIPPHSSVEEPSRGPKEPLRASEEPLPAPITDPEVGIPDYIIVHMGEPARPAQNIRATMLDYFRKVASHEIGPGFHVEAVKANVIAIMSYTLNRIYTEHYKWAGHEFDITGIKTDQVFIPNQTLQSYIVDIVDELFGTYIGTRGLKKPNLTQYGRTPVRDWLHQSKANELAQSGKNHMEILRHFYNRKYGPLEIRRATPAGEKFDTFPGELKLGDRGLGVQMLQRRLKALNKTFWAIRVIGLVEDGVFGPKTEKAVKVFEKDILGIPATGIVTRRLWNRLSEYYWPRVEPDRQSVYPYRQWSVQSGYGGPQAGYWRTPNGYWNGYWV